MKINLSKTIRKWFNLKYCSTVEKRAKLSSFMKKLGFEPKLIVLMDGGICSQINQFMIGEYFVDKNRGGYKVEYDLTFFDKNGKDMYGVFDRNYQLDKIISLKENQLIKASEKTIKTYIRYFFNSANASPNNILDWVSEDFCPPMYLNNYYCFKSEDFSDLFNKYIHIKDFKEILDQDNQKIAEQIINTDSVGIHVRLGDMSKAVAYIEPVSVDYYLRAMNLPEFKNKEFYFFSEEPDWIEKNILPQLDNNIKTTIIKNPSNEGFKDLILLSLCKHQIASQGSFGPYSYLLNKNKDKICVLPDFKPKPDWKKLYDWNIIFKNNYLIKLKP